MLEYPPVVVDIGILQLLLLLTEKVPIKAGSLCDVDSVDAIAVVVVTILMLRKSDSMDKPTLLAISRASCRILFLFLLLLLLLLLLLV